MGQIEKCGRENTQRGGKGLEVGTCFLCVVRVRVSLCMYVCVCV